MKFLRKLIALVVGVVFFAALIISVGMIFAVKNINVTLVTYADDYTDGYEGAKASLKKLKGESMLFVDREETVKIVAESNYSLAEFEKKYPCTINVTLKERLETFAVSVGGMYSMYDSDGRFLRNCLENVNINDGSPNVELTGINVESIPEIAAIASVFKQTFKSFRSAVTTVSVESKPEVEGYADKLCFQFRCGLKIILDDYKNDVKEKIGAAYAKFETLNDRQKLSGVIRSYRMGGEEGLINADYSM